MGRGRGGGVAEGVTGEERDMGRGEVQGRGEGRGGAELIFC